MAKVDLRKIESEKDELDLEIEEMFLAVQELRSRQKKCVLQCDICGRSFQAGLKICPECGNDICD